MSDEKSDDRRPRTTWTEQSTPRTPAVPAVPSTPTPSVIDSYRLLKRIGEGGFGEVWLAEQTEPVRRRVALKVIKPGMDSRQVIARFESERQALALMDHPYIAKVLDAGATETGRPYFVMEHVQGAPITEFCDRHHLDTAARLWLIVQVCEGVQHAHQKAIIHRDLKPSNVLVAMHDGKPQPKIIDFGVAKAMAQRLTDKTMFTRAGAMIGTPEYMSPEQAELTSEDIDTRSDVYSLGVLLYELLVGTLPFDLRDVREIGFDEIRRKIREEDPPRPSTRISRIGDISPVTAENRRTDLPSLARRLKGDLDWIVMKALEKERARRYGSPGDLAADIERHLHDQPVEAGPPSASYRVGKFVRRNRLAVVASGVMLFGLVAGLGLATYGLWRATQAEADARQDADAARQVAEFMVELFEGPDPGEARGNTITAREILDRGVTRIENGLENQPRTRAMLMETMGRVYRVLGLYNDARPLLERAVELREAGPAEETLELASALDELATGHLWLGNYDEAESIARRSLAIREHRLGPDHADVAASLNTLGNALQHLSRLDDAGEVHRRAVSIREAALGRDAAEVGVSLHNLAIVHHYKQDYAEAERLYVRAIEIEEGAHGPDHYTLGASLHTLAMVYRDQRRFHEAVALERRSLAIREKTLGPDHPHVAYSLMTLGEIHAETGSPAEGEPLIRRAVAIGDAAWDPLYPELRWMHRSLAEILADQGKYAEAESILHRMLRLSEDAEAESALPDTLNLLGRIAGERGQIGEAEALYRRSLAIDERISGMDSPYLVPGLGGLANLYRDQGRFADAEPLYRRALGIFEAARTPQDPARREILRDYAECLARAGRVDDATEVTAQLQSM
jgi:serine/threonine protein kinase/tetratricopeptide (TPR) repeat protein